MMMGQNQDSSSSARCSPSHNRGRARRCARARRAVPACEECTPADTPTAAQSALTPALNITSSPSLLSLCVCVCVCVCVSVCVCVCMCVRDKEIERRVCERGGCLMERDREKGQGIGRGRDKRCQHTRGAFLLTPQQLSRLLLGFGSGFRVQGSGFRVQGSGFRVQTHFVQTGHFWSFS